ncbi:EamA family transporter [Marinobacter sp. R17]|uniref:DMT family transporter n=1 Tax=Marinobacter sp. R17 TaxID=2484250 RepID=UPI000F4CC5E2|nr:DMT family transporter [Marinobacter sp. R17]ROT99187.1 EamA family transporter [Marinobacter sp. R17]
MTVLSSKNAAVRGAILIAIAAALWATTSIAAKTLFTRSELEPLALAFLRLCVACPFFGVLMWHTRKPGGFRLSRGLFIGLVGLGFLQAGYQGAYLWAVDLTGAGIATLITLCLAPVLVAIAAAPLLGERPTLTTVLALISAIVGTLMLVSGDISNPDATRLGGVMIAVLAAAVYAAFTLTSRHVSGSGSVFGTAFICFTTGAIVLAPIAYLTGSLDGLGALDGVDWLLIAYIGIVPTCVGYVCFFRGMETTPATTSSIIVTLEPLFAALLAWMILGESLGTLGIIGAVVLTVSVLVASRNGAPARDE